jgi:hypothetical protein
MRRTFKKRAYSEKTKKNIIAMVRKLMFSDFLKKFSGGTRTGGMTKKCYFTKCENA